MVTLQTEMYSESPEARLLSGNHIAIWRMIVLSILGVGIFFHVYWLYRNWKAYRDYTGIEVYPVWHGLTQLVPIYGLFRFHHHLQAYNQLLERRDVPRIPNPVFLALIYGAIWVVAQANASFEGRLESASWDTVFTVTDWILTAGSWVGFVVAIVITCLVQSRINRYWAAVGDGFESRARIGKGEILVVVVGILVWIGLWSGWLVIVYTRNSPKRNAPKGKQRSMPNHPQAEIAIIGGSGLYEIQGFTESAVVDIDTPYGKPSDVITVGELLDVPVAFLPRHGRGHRVSPTELPFRANIYALKTLGVKQIVSVSAVGSLQARFQPQHLVVPDQLIDRTRFRDSTFFEGGVVAHITFADPFCPAVSNAIAAGGDGQGIPTHQGATLVVMEGPAFSSRAESEMYRSWGGDLIGMTALPEAKLAREAEMCYGTMAWVTDYDCWHPDHAAVTVDMVVENLIANIANSRIILRHIVPALAQLGPCDCQTALANAIITDKTHISDEARRRLEPIAGKYLNLR